ncbi:MAG: hypothetical protein BWX77_00125 [Bacteroidetes bacterium ADurb.Bin090]|nr:MAG: hypothetical protein BWX77_00125 [Bacteroidetes bacterium ADurb.Bin090]
MLDKIFISSPHQVRELQIIIPQIHSVEMLNELSQIFITDLLVVFTKCFVEVDVVLIEYTVQFVKVGFLQGS